MLHRGQTDGASLARRIAINSPAYLIWSPDDDALARPVLDQMLAAIARELGAAPLVITLVRPARAACSRARRRRCRASSPRSPRRRDADSQRAADRLAQAIGAISADLRHCTVERGGRADGERSAITMQLPSIHLRPDGEVYPQLEHELSVAFGDALLQAACAFIDDGERAAPAHYRALGRRAFLAAAKSADRKLGAVARSFDFLLSVSPINTGDAAEQFLADKGESMPEFRYRPLAVDPDRAKRALYDIDLSILEDPLLERLLSEKRREIDQQLTMLATRNTPAFRPASTMLYGSGRARIARRCARPAGVDRCSAAARRRGRAPTRSPTRRAR